MFHILIVYQVQVGSGYKIEHPNITQKLNGLDWVGSKFNKSKLNQENRMDLYLKPN